MREPVIFPIRVCISFYPRYFLKVHIYSMLRIIIKKNLDIDRLYWDKFQQLLAKFYKS